MLVYDGTYMLERKEDPGKSPAHACAWRVKIIDFSSGDPRHPHIRPYAVLAFRKEGGIFKTSCAESWESGSAVILNFIRMRCCGSKSSPIFPVPATWPFLPPLRPCGSALHRYLAVDSGKRTGGRGPLVLIGAGRFREHLALDVAGSHLRKIWVECYSGFN